MDFEHSSIPEFELNLIIFRDYLLNTFDREQLGIAKGEIHIYEDSLSDYANYPNKISLLEATINDPELLELDWVSTIDDFQLADYSIERHINDLRKRITYLKNQYTKADEFLFSKKQASLKFHWDAQASKNEVKLRSMAEELSAEARKYAQQVFYKEHVPMDPSSRFIRFRFEIVFK